MHYGSDSNLATALEGQGGRGEKGDKGDKGDKGKILYYALCPIPNSS